MVCSYGKECSSQGCNHERAVHRDYRRKLRVRVCVAMAWIDWIIKIGGAITALGIIWAAVNAAVNAAVKKFLAPLADDIKELKEHSHENYLSGLRLTIMSSDMPLGERIVAAAKYIEKGGNGEIKKFAIEHLHIQDVYHHETTKGE